MLWKCCRICKYYRFCNSQIAESAIWFTAIQIAVNQIESYSNSQKAWTSISLSQCAVSSNWSIQEFTLFKASCQNKQHGMQGNNLNMKEGAKKEAFECSLILSMSAFLVDMLQKPGNDRSWWQEFPFRSSETKLVNWLHN